MEAKLLTKVAPTLPRFLVGEVSGSVVFRAIIGKDGRVANLAVISGPDMLRVSAVEAVRQWTYKPYLLDGVPTAVDTTIVVNYPKFGGTISTSAAPPEYELDGDVKVIKVSSRVMDVLIDKLVDPVYPSEANWFGAVAVNLRVAADGAVKDASVQSGPEQLREAALTAVRQWKYKPYLLNGEPVEVDTTAVVRFTRIPGSVIAGRMITKIEPVYPKDARKKHITGIVVLHAIIGTDGRIRNLSVVSGPDALRNSSIDAVKQWTYQPYTMNGTPTEVDTTITVTYAMGK
jgi:TonB family protein